MTAAAQEGRREIILAAALAVFTRHGFAAATIDEVCRLSGASVGSIYHHVGGKEQLAAALYADGLADYQEGARRVLQRHRAAERGVKALVRHHLRWVADNPELATFLLHRRETEVRLAGRARVRELNRAAFGELRAWLNPHVQAGRIRALPLGLFLAVVIGPSQEFARHWLTGRDTTQLTRAQRVLARAAWHAVRNEHEGG